MPAAASQTSKPLLPTTLNKVKHHEPLSLYHAVKAASLLRNLNRSDLRSSLAMLLANIHYSNLEGRTTTISYLSQTFQCDYNLLTMRISSLVSLGHLSKHKVYTKHSERYKNLQFGYFSYQLTDSGIRYLLDIFCKEDDI